MYANARHTVAVAEKKKKGVSCEERNLTCFNDKSTLLFFRSIL